MLIREGQARDHRVDRRLACSLALVAGGLNAAGFYAAGLYSSNMTGNVSALADHIATGDLTVAGLYLALVATFIAGALVSTLLANAGRRRQLTGVYLFSILLEAALLLLLGTLDVFLPDPLRPAVMVFGLSFLMGLQNAVVTRISNARVRTTHVTGMVTDIGIELANLLSRRAGEAFDRERLTLHLQTVAAFLAGGVIGVLAYRRLGPVLLFAAALLLLAMAAPGMLTWRARRIAADTAGG
jgi:uncharacterized membrane protein YoaK (UPF0700 family)